jgi:type VI secretion system protein ImpB
MAKGTQEKLGRVRPPRIQISYEVDLGNGIEMKELPFLMGVLGDFSGNPTEPLPRVKDRAFVEVTPDNFDDVLSSMKPHLNLSVANKLGDDPNGKLGVSIDFRSMDDFSPAAVAKQVPALKQLLELREELSNLRANLQTNDRLNDVLQQTLGSDDKMKALRSELGLEDGSNG